MERKSGIILEEYNPAWHTTFEQLKSVYQECLQDLVVSIEHVGSTSVVGLAAKPIIDIDLVIESKETMNKVIEKLIHLGYRHQGDLGITGRESFKRLSDTTPLVANRRTWPPHHLYACLQGNTGLRNHLQFRNYLRQHPEKISEYARLKKQLATLYPFDMDQYVAGKTGFITEILKQTGISQSEIDQIVVQNKVK
ncbi:GrpB family protein [Cytophagaceae bacterium DM2B3-1]|uniref:GrpB family protein n=1 Tax=Xanthocytophaga flava TaxID=3048013 RepID=A0ABT7CS47_9BACT|nr:GrpB family protein [Xanthocytophaga flavus]MDJ1496574.1 GrpB family protein [Xanthocytophaga flavus]